MKFLLFFFLFFSPILLHADMSPQPNVKIFVAMHKPSIAFVSDVITPIHVGKAKSKTNLGIAGDNTGDNISDKDPFYSEVSAIYWMWKNVEADIVGLYQYRRYLDLNENLFEIPLSHKHFSYLTGNNLKSITTLMEEYDIILPHKEKLKTSLYNHFILNHPKEGIDTVLEVIKEKYPEEYEKAYMALQEKEGYFHNIFITKKEVLNDYASWLFDILFETEKRVHHILEKKSSHDRRHYGFLAERLLHIYIALHPELIIKEVPLLKYYYL